MTFRPSHYVTAFLLLVVATSAVSQTLYLRADRLIDGLSDTVISNPVVLIEGDRISRVGDADSIRIPAGANVLELQGATLLPGLLDAHVHLLSNHDDKGFRRLEVTANRSVINGVVNAEKTLMAGFTTVRVVGSGGYGDVALRAAIAEGDIAGPRILAAGP